GPWGGGGYEGLGRMASGSARGSPSGAVADAPDELAGGDPRDQVDALGTPAAFEHALAPHDLPQAPVGALDQHIGPEVLDEPEWGVFGEGDDVVDGRQGGQHLGAFGEAKDGTSRTLLP